MNKEPFSNVSNYDETSYIQLFYMKKSNDRMLLRVWDVKFNSKKERILRFHISI